MPTDPLPHPDNDQSFRSPHAWHKAKLAFGWKPQLDRNQASRLVNALLDLEDHARHGGGCVRLMLELAIRNYLELTREQKLRAHFSIFAEYERENADSMFTSPPPGPRR